MEPLVTAVAIVTFSSSSVNPFGDASRVTVGIAPVPLVVHVIVVLVATATMAAPAGAGTVSTLPRILKVPDVLVTAVSAVFFTRTATVVEAGASVTAHT